MTGMRAAVRFLFLLFPLFAGAQSGTKIHGLIVNAEHSERDTETDIIELEGNVQIIFKEQHLRCDRARINLRSKTVDAVGRVHLTSQETTIRGQRILLDYEGHTGLIFDGFVRSGPALFEGSMISKTGPDEYLVNTAQFTTCHNCPETWSFSGERIRAQLGGYAFIKNSLLRVGGVPVFWLPYLIVPLKSDRQTGLLTPELAQSDAGGLEFSQSLFWAIDRSRDATITLTNYEKRGLKGLVNYRHVFSESSQAELDFASLRDRAFPQSDRVSKFQNPEDRGQIINRWFTRYEHYIDLPDGFVHRMQVNNASDLQYPKDFPLETLNHGDPAMENRMSLTKNWSNHHLSVDSSYYVNLLQADPLASNSDTVHRVPEISYRHTLAPLGESSWLYNLDINSTHFARAEFGYDDLMVTPEGHKVVKADGPGCNTATWHNNPACRPVRDGTFDRDLDLIRTGHRLDMQASLLRPFNLGRFVDVVPRLTYRETQYQFNLPSDRAANRKLIRTELSGRSVFSKVYGDLSSYRGRRWKHEIQPEISFKAVPWINQSAHPFFGNAEEVPFFSQENISDGDIDSPYGLQFDYFDRLYDRRVVTMAITNRIISKRWPGQAPEYRQDFAWRLSQSYDFHQAELDRATRQPWSDLQSEMKLNLDRISLYQQLRYFPYHQATNISSRVRWNFVSGDFAQLVHNYRHTIVPGQPLDPNTLTQDYTLSLRARYRIADLIGKMTYNPHPPNRDEHFTAYGYGLVINLPGNCLHFRFMQYRPTGGENAFKFSFDFNWDGKAKAQIPETFLDSF